MESSVEARDSAEVEAQVAEAMRRIEEAEQTVRGPVRMDFQSNGYIYRYEFDELTLEQIMLAESVFNYRNHQLRKPARSLREYEIGGQMDYMAKAFSYLLVKILPDGSVELWSRKKSRDEAEKFVLGMKGKDWARLRECQDDFFNRANIVDVESIMLLTPLIESGAAAQSQSGTDQRNGQDVTEKSSSVNEDSMIPVS